MIMDGMGFLAVIVSPLVISLVLVAPVTGGALRSIVRMRVGTAICTTPMASYTSATTIRETVFMFVASGIN